MSRISFSSTMAPMIPKEVKNNLRYGNVREELEAKDIFENVSDYTPWVSPLVLLPKNK